MENIAIIALISSSGHVVVAGIKNYLISLSIPYSLCPQQAPQWVVILW